MMSRKVEDLFDEGILHSNQFHFNPLPPPDICLQYESITPGFTDRILKLYETRNHVLNLDDKSKISIRISGNIFGFCIVLYGMYIGHQLAQNGESLQALTAFLSSVASCAAFFAIRKSIDK